MKLSPETIHVDAHLVEGFVEAFLLSDFDQPKPCPEFHRQLWELFCSPAPLVAVAAPRGHAKSTAGTLAFTLASLLFGSDDFVLLVSATERLAASHLSNMARVLTTNSDLILEFGVEVVKCNETELTARIGNREFHILGKGGEQAVRGALWNNKRPSLIIIDDLESDEAVMSKERREKLRDWFDNALLPCGSDNLRVRFLGTILHLDSLLERLITDTEGGWVGRRFKAHASFDDFTELLWPEKWTEQRLRNERRRYLAAGNPSGYSQEYLSQPVAEADAYFKKSDFREMTQDDFLQPKRMYASIDFALGKDDKGDNTAIVVAGLDSSNILHIVDMYAQRYDPLEAISKMFELQEIYDIEAWMVEDDNISKAIGPFLNAEMQRRGHFLPLERLRPHKDKQARATSIQARMRAGGAKFNCSAPWFFELYNEMINFPRGKTDDRVDALAWIGLFLDKMAPSQTREELDEEAWQAEVARGGDTYDGRSHTTGY
jgi:predicted phage terminase large subunit-like protein